MRTQIVAGFGLSFLSACTLPFSPNRDVILYIREILAPPSVGAAAPFDATFAVEVGGCRTFDRLEMTQSPGGAVVIAHGEDAFGPNVTCPNDVRYEQHKLTMSPPFTDPFVIRAGQPNASEIRVEVRVTP
jgi:hypothetical protein